jgi:hypothetical protein
VGAVIEDDQVILVTRDTQNMRGPRVTVYKVKGLNNSSGGAREGQPDVPTKQIGMIQGIISALRAGDSGSTRQLGEDNMPGWPRRRCQVAEEAVVARAYETACGVGVVEVGRCRV